MVERERVVVPAMVVVPVPVAAPVVAMVGLRDRHNQPEIVPCQ